MKRKLSLILILALLMGVLASCNSPAPDSQTPSSNPPSDAGGQSADPSDPGENPGEPEEDPMPPMTEDNIKLTLAFWGQELAGEPEVVAAQMKQFTDKYPNIELEFIYIDQALWADSLQNLAAIGELPDVFGVFSVSQAAMNEWALPLDEFYDIDPDTKDMFDSFASNALINGVRYSMPWTVYPHMVFLNKTVFEKYNVALPSADWTVDEFFDLAAQLSHPEEFYFGTSNPIYEDLYPAWYVGGQGKWGWDGQNYNFDQTWIDAMNKRYAVLDARILEWETAEDKERFLGASDAWPPGWGRVALHIDWPWSIAYFENDATQLSNSEFLYYPLPTGPSGQQLVIVDNAVVASSTQYPREAWELLKYMAWGEEAMLTRQQTYRENGLSITRVPATANQAAWDDLINNTVREDMKAFYQHLTNLVPSPWPVSPAWDDIQTWINEQDIYGRMERREITPADIAPELEAKANELKDAWIAKLP